MAKNQCIVIPDFFEDYHQRTGKRLRWGTDETWAKFCRENCRKLTPEEVAASDKEVADHKAFMGKVLAKPDFDEFMNNATGEPAFSAFMAKAVKKPRQSKARAA